MILNYWNNTTGYPFIQNCSRKLNDGLVLRDGSILDILLYPPCGPVDYAQITRIGRGRRDRTTGEIEITGPGGELLCVVKFPNIDVPATQIIGTAYYGEAIPCGCVVCSRDILPILQSDYYPDYGSFVFTPSVFRPRTNRTISGSLKDMDGNQVTDIKFKNKSADECRGFTTVDGVTSLIECLGDVENSEMAVLTVTVNGTRSKDGIRHLRISPSVGSPVRVDTINNELSVGVGCEL